MLTFGRVRDVQDVPFPQHGAVQGREPSLVSIFPLPSEEIRANMASFITCNSCGSRRSVQAIKTGFSAQVGKRRKMQQG